MNLSLEQIESKEYHDRFHKKVEELMGDPWCPYPSYKFMEAIMMAQDHVAANLIKIRRTYSFPEFVRGDPQREDIEIIFSTNANSRTN